MSRRSIVSRRLTGRRGGSLSVVVIAVVVSSIVVAPAVQACSQPHDYSSASIDDDVAALTREAPIVVSAVYATETDLTSPGSPVDLRRQRVDAELRVTHVFRCGFAGCCLPSTIVARDIWLRDCTDLRSAFVPRREYLLLLRDAGDGTYRVGGSSGPRAQLRRWFFDVSNASIAARARNATCATAKCVAALPSLCQPDGALPPLPASAPPSDRSAAAAVAGAQRAEFDNVPIVDEAQPSLASLDLGSFASGDSEVDSLVDASDETSPNGTADRKR